MAKHTRARQAQATHENNEVLMPRMASAQLRSTTRNRTAPAAGGTWSIRDPNGTGDSPFLAGPPV